MLVFLDCKESDRDINLSRNQANDTKRAIRRREFVET